MIWKWRQLRVGLIVAMAVLACVIGLVRPGHAHAGWPLKTAGTVALGFGQKYQSGSADSVSTHRGVDVVAEPGCTVLAPLAGSVTFAGRIPAAGGGTVGAVTIATAAGSVTLLPLEGSAVVKGDSVAEGDAVGTLAEGGDGSSAGPHLHVGVKRGDLYVDPLSVLAMPTAAGGSERQQDGRTTGDEEASAGHASASADAGGERAAADNDVSAAERLQPETPERDNSSARAGSVIPGAVLEPGVSVAGGPATRGQSAGNSVGARARISAGAGRSAGSRTRSAGSGASETATISELAARLGQLARSAGKALAVGLLVALAAIGALWPLWRTEQRKDSGEIRVSTVGDDVAAVVGR